MAGVLLVAISYIGVWRAQPACYREALVNSRTRLQLERSLADQLRNLPPKATLLMYLGEHVGVLQDAGIVTTVRRTRGDDIDAACGQLKGQVMDRTRRSAEFRKRLQAPGSHDAAA